MILENFIIPEYENIESSNNMTLISDELYDVKVPETKRTYYINCEGVHLTSIFKKVTPEKIADDVLNGIISGTEKTLVAVFYQNKLVGFMFDKIIMEKWKCDGNNIVETMYLEACDNEISEATKKHICFYKNKWILVLKKDLNRDIIEIMMDDFVLLDEKPETKKSNWFWFF